MRYEMDIRYPLEEMRKSQRRVKAFEEFGRPDRVPVDFCLAPRYFTHRLGIPYSEFFQSPERQFELQLEFQRHRIENIRSDMLTEPVLWVHPYFDNVTSASHFGGHVEWPENETLQAVPNILSLEEMARFTIPEPTAGLYGTVIEWWQRMKELAEETKVTFDGTPGKVVVSGLSTMPLGPHMIAVDLIGSDFYWWCLEEPELCKEFLMKITQAQIECEDLVRRIDPREGADEDYGIAEDSSTVLSPEMFREFVVPYDRMLFDRYGRKTRGIHMCGPSLHLHESLVQDLDITHFSLFGYIVQPEDIARTMGNRVRLQGNINPMLMLSGSRDEVVAEVRRTLEVLGPVNGFELTDGANVCPGTSFENLNALVETSEAYAAAHPESFIPLRREEMPPWTSF